MISLKINIRKKFGISFQLLLVDCLGLQNDPKK